MRPSISCLFIVILLSYAVESFSQQKLDYGIKGGITMGALIGNIDPETSSGAPAWGPHFGLFLQHSLSDKFSIRPEIIYNKSGVSYQEQLPRTDTLYEVLAAIDTFQIPTFFTSDIKGEYDMHFIDCSLKLGYKIGKKMSIILGPRISYLIKGYNVGTRIIDVGEVAGQQQNFMNEEEYLDALFTRSIEEYDDGNTIEKLNFGLVFGSQFQFSEHMSAYFDSNVDLSILQKRSENVPYELRHLYLTLGLSYNL